jgi:phosphate transport system ATP-binding protein
MGIEIRVNGFNLWYGENHALKDIKMEIEKNKVTAIIGPSGCGKSTFIRSLNRMNDLVPSCITKGDIFFDGMEIYEKDLDVYTLRKRVGMVFQKPNPFPMSVYDNISYGPRIHGEKNKKKLDKIVEHTLKSAALWDEVNGRLDDPASV